MKNHRKLSILICILASSTILTSNQKTNASKYINNNIENKNFDNVHLNISDEDLAF